MKDEMLRELDKDFESKNLTQEQYDAFKAEIIAKGEQSEKLIEDRKAGKVDQSQFEMWADAIGNDYRDINARKHEAIKNNKQALKRKKRFYKHLPFIVIAFGLLVILGVYLVRDYIYVHREIADIPEPIQVDSTEDEFAVVHEVDGKELFGDDYYLKMNYLASYDIQGLVLGTHTFSKETVYERSFPFDVSIAWGDAAANRRQFNCTNGPRKLSCRTNNDIIQKYSRTIYDQYSNNHLSPADEEVRKKIFKIKAGDYIQIKGYLVMVEATSDDGQIFQATSSTVRTDRMDSAFDRTNTGCELIYVTSVDWL